MELDILVTSNLQLLKVGGAITGRSSLLARRFGNSPILSEANKNVVVMSMYLKNGLTQPEFRSIYYHEIGHYVKRHHLNEGKLISWQDKELEADAYSARLIGAKVLLSALEKIPVIIRECKPLRIQAKHINSDEDYYRDLDIFLNIIKNKMQFRYLALRRMN